MTSESIVAVLVCIAAAWIVFRAATSPDADTFGWVITAAFIAILGPTIGAAAVRFFCDLEVFAMVLK